MSSEAFARSTPCRSVIDKLSKFERSQLGQQKSLVRGGNSEFKYPSAGEWIRLRKILLERSLKSNPALNPRLTAYTPGETLWLMKQEEILMWHQKMKSFKVPDWVERIVFVPCAKTKPWADAKVGLYQSYNRIREMRAHGQFRGVYFVSISEPLGVVPESEWADFPQYDNPGLFKEEAMRSGLFTGDWPNIGFPQKRIVPFDPDAYQAAIKILGGVISNFIKFNSDKKFISFVGSRDEQTSHDDMLDEATLLMGEQVDLSKRYPRRPAARKKPYELLVKVLKARAK